MSSSIKEEGPPAELAAAAEGPVPAERAPWAASNLGKYKEYNTYFATAKKADGSLVTTDLGSCLAGAGVVHPREGKKANESFATTSLQMRRVAMEGRSPIWGIQMLLTYLRKIVALTIVVVGRRMFVDQWG